MTRYNVPYVVVPMFNKAVPWVPLEFCRMAVMGAPGMGLPWYKTCNVLDPTTICVGIIDWANPLIVITRKASIIASDLVVFMVLVLVMRSKCWAYCAA